MSFLFAISAMAIAIMFPVLLSLRTSGVAGVSRFSFACGLAAASICVAMFNGFAPQSFYGIASGALMIGASLMTLCGFRQFFGRPAPDSRVMLAAVAMPALGLAFFSYGIDLQVARSLIVSATVSLVFLLIAATILAHGQKDRNISAYMVICFGAACGISLFHMLRVLVLATGMEVIPGFADPRLWTVALPAARVLFLPLFFLSIILMVQGRMIAVLRHTVAHDDLTGVLSRPAFMAKLERRFEATMRLNSPMAFLLLDLDRFKQINDRFGHAGGDAALKHFAHVVGAHLGGRGHLGRLGGEEFGIVLPGVTEVEAMEFADGLCSAIRKAPVAPQPGATIQMTVSVGIAMAEQNGTAAETMICADAALYQAKASGRDCCVLAGRMHGDLVASTRVLSAVAAQMRVADADVPLTPSRASAG